MMKTISITLIYLIILLTIPIVNIIIFIFALIEHLNSCSKSKTNSFFEILSEFNIIINILSVMCGVIMLINLSPMGCFEERIIFKLNFMVNSIRLLFGIHYIIIFLGIIVCVIFLIFALFCYKNFNNLDEFSLCTILLINSLLEFTIIILMYKYRHFIMIFFLS
jgi:hypothetical protein